RNQRDHRSITHNRREAGRAWPVYQSESGANADKDCGCRMMTSSGEEELAKGSANTGPAIERSG
ncbi:MAG: hypothetical protein ACK56I_09260, partial [bacterium]